MNWRGYYFLNIVGAITYWIIFNHIERTNFGSLILLFLVSFFIYFQLIKICRQHLFWLIIPTMVFHAIAIVNIPLLSDDYWRYLWDGHLNAHGISPYLYTPHDIVNGQLNDSFLSEIYPHLNSPYYESVYPPLNQILYWFTGTSTTAHNGVIVLKTFMILGNGILFLALYLLTKKLKLSPVIPFLVILNPLLISETSANLHFEAFALGLFLMGLYYWLENKWLLTGVFFGMAVSVKIIPLLFIPFFIQYVGWKKTGKVVIGFVSASVLLAIPFAGLEVLTHLSESINLYFQTFEFNPSLYTMVTNASSLITGYDSFQFMGPIFGILFIAGYAYIMIKKRSADFNSLMNKFLWVVIIFYLLSTIVHPWYIVYPMVIGILINNSIGIVCSLLVLLSYCNYAEISAWWISLVTLIEYSLLFVYMWKRKYFERKLSLTEYLS
jgi:alpha-1,6-mannosyltransferase